MFSIMMTVESTTMPKSTAPSEIRLADVCVPTSPHEGDEQRERDVERRDERRAQCGRGRGAARCDTSVIPTRRFSRTVCVVSLHEIAAVVVRLDVHAGRQDVVVADVVDALVDALERRRRLAAVAHEHDALHDVRIVVVPTIPRRGA